MLTKLAEITDVAKHRQKEKFTSLAHLINVELLRICHDEMDGKKAVGIDKVTKEAYSENLEDNLVDLIARMKRQAYHPQPVRRVLDHNSSASLRNCAGARSQFLRYPPVCRGRTLTQWGTILKI